MPTLYVDDDGNLVDEDGNLFEPVDDDNADDDVEQVSPAVALTIASRILKDPYGEITATKDSLREILVGILKDDKPSELFVDLGKTGYLKKYMGWLYETVGVQQNPPHKYDVFIHTMRTLDNVCAMGDDASLNLRLAALFHDIGKYIVWQEKEWRHHSDIHWRRPPKDAFYEHEKASAEICEQMMTKYGFSSEDIQYVTKLVELHMDRKKMNDWLKAKKPKSYQNLSAYLRNNRIYILDIALLNLADSLACDVRNSKHAEQIERNVINIWSNIIDFMGSMPDELAITNEDIRAIYPDISERQMLHLKTTMWDRIWMDFSVNNREKLEKMVRKAYNKTRAKDLGNIPFELKKAMSQLVPAGILKGKAIQEFSNQVMDSPTEWAARDVIKEKLKLLPNYEDTEKNSPRPVPAKVKLEIIKLFAQGKSIYKISQITGKNSAWISNFLDKEGIREKLPAPAPVDPELKEKVINLRKLGYSYGDISNMVGSTVSQVQSIIQQAGMSSKKKPGSKTGRRFTQEENDTVISMWDEGYSVATISRYTKITPQSVRMILLRHRQITGEYTGEKNDDIVQNGRVFHVDSLVL